MTAARMSGGIELERLAVHRVLQPGAFGAFPGEGEEHAVVGARIFFQAALEEAGDRALRRADRAVQQEHAAFGAVLVGGRLEGVDQLRR